MSYVKKYDVGQIKLDLPHANYIHELPLLSFADIHGELNLSLVFNYEMIVNSEVEENPYNICPGYKLNLQKRLIIDTDSIKLQESTGKTIHFSKNNNIYLTFDDSQKIIRYANSQYTVENSDLSKEIYNSSGKIIASYDKYGVLVLSYSYNSNGRLTSISYRGKIITFGYDTSNRMKTIVYGGTTTQLTYTSSNILTVNLYTGDIIKLERSNDMDFTVKAMNGSMIINSTSIIQDPDRIDTLTVAECTDGVYLDSAHKVMNLTEYKFPNYTLPAYQNQVEITDKNGATTRIQYDDSDKPQYSYEIQDVGNGEKDATFLSQYSTAPYSGIVRLYNPAIDTKSDQASGFQTIHDGEYTVPNADCKEWTKDVSTYGEGYFTVSGWIKSPQIETESIIFKKNYNAVIGEMPINMNPLNKWKYFSVTFKENCNSIIISSVSETSIFKDVRITFEKATGGNESASHTNITEHVIISGSQEIPWKDAEFYYTVGETDTRVPGDVTFADVLRWHKRDKMQGLSDEIYYDNCFGVISGVDNFKIKYNGVFHIVEYTKLGIKTYSSTGIYLTEIGRVSSGFSVVKKKQRSNNTYKTIQTVINNEEFDAISSTVDGVETVYTRVNDLVTSKTVGDLPTVTTNYTTVQGNPTITQIDEFGRSTVYTLDPVWGNVTKVALPDGSEICDTYDSDGSALQSRSFNSARSNTLSYTNGLLSGISDGSLSYIFDHSAGKLTKVTKNGVSVEEHEHTDIQTDSYYPSKSSDLYQDTVKFDKYGRITEVVGNINNVYDINPTFNQNGTLTSVANNGSSLLAMSTDLKVGEVSRYEYNTNGTLKKKSVTGTSFSLKKSEESFEYDDSKRVSRIIYKDTSNGTKNVESAITYVSSNSSTPDQIQKYVQKIDGVQKAETIDTYDDYKRITNKSHKIESKTFNKSISYTHTRATSLTDAGVTTDYTYDDLGRIASVNNGEAVTYQYDNCGQLVNEANNVLDKTFQYEYNNIGNIASVTSTSASGTVSTTTFAYTDATHPDRLTSYNGKSISYNSMGCPTSYNGKTFTWAQGKLSQISTSSLLTGTERYTYTYNGKGQRTKKVYTFMPGQQALNQYVTSTTTNYRYDDSGRLMREYTITVYNDQSSETEDFVFLYDESGMIGFMRSVDGATPQAYYYQRNLQGDVVAIYDTNGTKQAGYAYDAWGNCTVVNNTNAGLAAANPIRYRGYYYDAESKWYFLNARYYSPEWRRFISPDDTAYLDHENANGLNLYAYCYNDPVNYADPSGNAALTIGVLMLIGFISGAAIGAASSVVGQYIANDCSWDNFSWGQLALDTFLGGASGLLSMSTLGTGAMIVANAGLGFVGAVGGHLINGSDFSNGLTWIDIALSTGLGALVGAIGREGALNVGYLNSAERTAGFVRAAGLYDDVLTKAANGFYRTSGIAANALRLSHNNLVKQWNKMVVIQAGNALYKSLMRGGIAMLFGTAGKGLLYGSL